MRSFQAVFSRSTFPALFCCAVCVVLFTPIRELKQYRLFQTRKNILKIF
nr:MAG TPA: hypothetical protein [Caudoviricetes sp.]